jgi:hypothetical protein
MKAAIAFLLIFSTGFFENVSYIDWINVTYAEQEVQVPSYAKWGQMAMQKTKEKYPTADIIDYLHIGREKGEKSSIEKFKLWVKEDNKEFGVIVTIEFDNETEKVIDISFKETSR